MFLSGHRPTSDVLSYFLIVKLWFVTSCLIFFLLVTAQSTFAVFSWLDDNLHLHSFPFNLLSWQNFLAFRCYSQSSFRLFDLFPSGCSVFLKLVTQTSSSSISKLPILSDICQNFSFVRMKRHLSSLSQFFPLPLRTEFVLFVTYWMSIGSGLGRSIRGWWLFSMSWQPWLADCRRDLNSVTTDHNTTTTTSTPTV